MTTKPSESVKLKFHLPIVSQLLGFFFSSLFFFSANELLNGVRPVGAFPQLVLGGAALSAYSTVTIFICIMG